jgi:hypothetical protein
VYALKNYQWRGEPCFAGAAISKYGYLRHRKYKKRLKVGSGKAYDSSCD